MLAVRKVQYLSCCCCWDVALLRSTVNWPWQFQTDFGPWCCTESQKWRFMRSKVSMIESGETNFADLNALPFFSCLLTFSVCLFRFEGPVWREGLGESRFIFSRVIDWKLIYPDLQMQCEILLLMLVVSVMYLPLYCRLLLEVIHLVPSLADNKTNS